MSENAQAEPVKFLAEVLTEALSPLWPQAVFPQVYTGQALRYVVWNYNSLPAVWAEDDAHAARYLVQVHLYLPHKEDPHAAILALSEALHRAGLTRPDVTDASDSEGQHWVLECEYADGGARYGYA